MADTSTPRIYISNQKDLSRAIELICTSTATQIIVRIDDDKDDDKFRARTAIELLSHLSGEVRRRLHLEIPRHESGMTRILTGVDIDRHGLTEDSNELWQACQYIDHPIKFASARIIPRPACTLCKTAAVASWCRCGKCVDRAFCPNHAAESLSSFQEKRRSRPDPMAMFSSSASDSNAKVSSALKQAERAFFKCAQDNEAYLLEHCEGRVLDEVRSIAVQCGFKNSDLLGQGLRQLLSQRRDGQLKKGGIDYNNIVAVENVFFLRTSWVCMVTCLLGFLTTASPVLLEVPDDEQKFLLWRSALLQEQPQMVGTSAYRWFIELVMDVQTAQHVVAPLFKQLADESYFRGVESDATDIITDLYDNGYLEKLGVDVRSKLGAYFTPPETVDFMFMKLLGNNTASAVFNVDLNAASIRMASGSGKPIVARIIDPSMGSATFLCSYVNRVLAAVREELPEVWNGDADLLQAILDDLREAVWGIDLDEFTTYVAQCNVSMHLLPLSRQIDLLRSAGSKESKESKTLLPKPSHLHCANALKIRQHKMPKNGFHYVVGNPPYLDCQQQDETVMEGMCVAGTAKAMPKCDFGGNLFYPFVYMGTQLLIPSAVEGRGGRLCFVLPGEALLQVNPCRVFRRAMVDANAALTEAFYFPNKVLFDTVDVANTIVVMERDAIDKTMRLCRINDEGATAYRGWPELFQMTTQDILDGKAVKARLGASTIRALMYEQSFASFVTQEQPALWPLAFGNDDVDAYALVNSLMCQDKKKLNKSSPFKVVDDILNVFLGANTSNNDTFYMPTTDAVNLCEDPVTHKYVHPSGYTDTHKKQLSVSGKFGLIPTRDCDKSSLEWKLAKGRQNVLIGVDLSRAKAFREECGKTKLFMYLQDRFEGNAEKQEGKETNKLFISKYPREKPLEFAAYKRELKIDKFAMPWKIVVVGTSVFNAATRSVARFSLDEDGLAFKEDVPTLVVKPRIAHLDERYFLAVFNSPIFEYWARFRQYKGRRMWRLKQGVLLECTIAMPSAEAVKEIHYINWVVEELITATGLASGLNADSTSQDRSDVWDGMEESRYDKLSEAGKAAYDRRSMLRFAANDFIFSVFGVDFGDRAILSAVIAGSDPQRIFEPPSLKSLQHSLPAVGLGVVPAWAAQKLGYSPGASVRPRPEPPRHFKADVDDGSGAGGAGGAGGSGATAVKRKASQHSKASPTKRSAELKGMCWVL